MVLRKFQRARKPDEKEVRRQAILKAARRLVNKVGPVALSLSELARRSGVSKPNIYRYFESREEVLLQLWMEEIGGLIDDLVASLPAVAVGDVPGAAKTIVDAFTARPELCHLTSIIAVVIEPNLSAQALLGSKLSLAALIPRFAQALHERLPAISFVDCAWVASAAATYVAGIWPAANPGPVAAEVMARPELAGMSPDFQRELTRFLEVIMSGLLKAQA